MKGLGNATVLVLGGAGFIGSNFIRQVLATSLKTKIVCVDALTYAGNKDNLKGLPKDRFTFVKGNLTDKSLISGVFKKYRPAYVINFAAETHVDRSIHVGARDFVQTNVYGTLVLLEAIREVKPPIKKFVHVSTDEVYGALALSSKKRFTEESPLQPNSPYAASKAAADLLARSFFVTYGLPIVITRASNNYGPYQYPEKFIPYSITRLLEGKPIALYGDGRYVRDWIHVEDHSAALILALADGVLGEVYNIGAGDEISNRDIAERLVGFFKKDSSAIAFVKDRPGHDRRYAIDASKITRELGWKPRHVLKDSFGPTIQWYVGNVAWIKRALAISGTANTHI